MKKKSSLLTFALLALLLSACSFSLAADVTPPPDYQPPTAVQTQIPTLNGPLYPIVAPNPADGEAIFAEKCSPCHGDLGRGDGPRAAQLPNPVPAIGTAEISRQSTPAEWYRTVTQGNIERFMPPFNSLADNQRWDVIAYVYRLGMSQDALEKGQILFEENCARCHGETGKGDGVDAASLATKPKDLTRQDYLSQKSSLDLVETVKSGVAPAMPAFTGKISEGDLLYLADYLRSLSFVPSESLAQAEALTPTAVPDTLEVSSTLTSSETISPGLTTVTVQGSVLDGKGVPMPAGTIITLHIFDQMQNVVTQTMGLAEDGSFGFENVPASEGHAYLTTVKYQAVVYSSDIGQPQGSPTIDLPIQVYESTPANDTLNVDRLHIFFDLADPQMMRVVELYVISNNGDKTVAPAETGKPNLAFTLPQGATNLEFQDGVLGERFVKTENGFADTVPIRPGSGSYQVIFSYLLPYAGSLKVEHPIDLPTSAVVVLVPAETLQLNGQGLVDAGVRDVQNTKYQMYNSSNLTPGNPLSLEVSEKSVSLTDRLALSSKSNLMIGIGALGLVLIFLGVWMYFRNRPTNAEDEDDEEEGTAPSKEESAEMVMDAILALDDMYKEGKLSEQAYQQRRAELKERLKDLMNPS